MSFVFTAVEENQKKLAAEWGFHGRTGEMSPAAKALVHRSQMTNDRARALTALTLLRP